MTIKQAMSTVRRLMTVRYDDQHPAIGGASSDDIQESKLQQHSETSEENLQHSDVKSPEESSQSVENTDNKQEQEQEQEQQLLNDDPKVKAESDRKLLQAASDQAIEFVENATDEEKAASQKAQEADYDELEAKRQEIIEAEKKRWTTPVAPKGKKVPKNYLNKDFLKQLERKSEMNDMKRKLHFKTRRPLSYTTLKLLLDEEQALRHLYDDYDNYRNLHNRPIEYDNRLAVRTQLKRVAQAYQNRKAEAMNKSHVGLDIADAAWIIIKTAALTVVPSGSTSYALAAYDYDRKVYTLNPNDILKDYITAIFGSVSRSQLQSLTMTLEGRRDELAVYHALPNYKVAVKNGIYNCITATLEPYTPEYTITSIIDTEYKPNAKAPDYGDGFTLEKMIDNLANHVNERCSLIKEIVKAILTGRTIKPAVFFVVGRGGDGKSTFFSLICNILGKENVAYLNMSEIDQPDKLLEIVGKKLILGTDNDVKLYIRKTANIKTIASHESMSFSRKYLTAMAARVTATMVQLCNQFPRFAETGSSMRRRIVPMRAEHSYYEENSENANVDDKYIYDKAFKEYALKYFLECEYHADFSDIDAGVALDSFSNEDTITQFLQDMDDIGLFASNQKQLPTSHLYAAYCDWLETSNPGTRPLAKRAFTSQLTEPLSNFGYKVKDHQAKRLNKLIEKGDYIPDLWGSYKNGDMLKAALAPNNDRPSQCFQKIDRRTAPRKMTRDDRVISPEEYFGLVPDLYNVEREHPNLKDTNLIPGIYDYGELSDIMGLDYNELSQPWSEGPQAPTSIQLQDEAAKAQYEQFKSDMKAKGISEDQMPTVTPLVVLEQQRVADDNAKRAEGPVGDLVDILESTASARRMSLTKEQLFKQGFLDDSGNLKENSLPKGSNQVLLSAGAAAAADGFSRLDVDRPDDFVVVSDALAKADSHPELITKAVKVLNGISPFIDPCGNNNVKKRLMQNLFSPKMAEALPKEIDTIDLGLLEQQARNTFTGFDQSYITARYRALHGYIDLEGLISDPARMTKAQVDTLVGISSTKNEHDRKLVLRNTPTLVTLAREINKQVDLLKNRIGGDNGQLRLAASGLVGLQFNDLGNGTLERDTTDANRDNAEAYIRKVGLVLLDLDKVINGDKSFIKQMLQGEVSEDDALANAVSEIDPSRRTANANDLKGGAE